MAEILGLGVTHWPTLCMPNEGLTGVFKTTLRAPNVDAARRVVLKTPVSPSFGMHRVGQWVTPRPSISAIFLFLPLEWFPTDRS